jgi:hypothetical protein
MYIISIHIVALYELVLYSAEAPVYSSFELYRRYFEILTKYFEGEFREWKLLNTVTSVVPLENVFLFPIF